MNFAPKLLAASGKSAPLCGPRAERGALRLLVLLLVGLPGCTRTTPGFCTTDDDCTRAQYCALPAAQCTDAIVLRAVLTGDQVVPPTASLARKMLRKVVALPGPPPVKTNGSV